VRVWSIANQKGGVGKTTTVVSLGGLLAAQGQRVLLLDLDPHGSLTSYFRFDHDSLPKSSFDIFQMSAPFGERDVEALVVPTNQPNLSLIPATTGLATVERLLQGQDGLGLKISKALAQLWDDYDYAIIDTPPVLGVLMINALAACEKLLIPVQTEHLAIKGLERMLRTLTMINRSRKTELPYVIVPTMFDRRTHASTASLRILRNEHADHVWPAVVPVDTRFRDASKIGQVPSVFDAKARGVAAYDGLLRFLLRPANQALSA
jgi:chromosome partitioning protein